jgi:Fe-Mn family superoxide dismutase
MRKDFTPEPLQVNKDLDGITLKLIQNHYKLYEGYVKKTNEIQNKLESVDRSEANASFSLVGELKRQETVTVNGMKLHEVYFGHLGPSTDSAGSPQAGLGQAGIPKGELVKMIEKDFGSLENWKVDMVATGLAARGWAITAFDYRDNRLHNYGSDAHNVGAVWGAIPVIVLDVYEHAYFMDYGVDRKSYIDSFFKNLNWDFANEIVKKYQLQEKQAQLL